MTELQQSVLQTIEELTLAQAEITISEIAAQMDLEQASLYSPLRALKENGLITETDGVYALVTAAEEPVNPDPVQPPENPVVVETPVVTETVPPEAAPKRIATFKLNVDGYTAGQVFMDSEITPSIERLSPHYVYIEECE